MLVVVDYRTTLLAPVDKSLVSVQLMLEAGMSERKDRKRHLSYRHDEFVTAAMANSERAQDHLWNRVSQRLYFQHVLRRSLEADQR